MDYHALAYRISGMGFGHVFQIIDGLVDDSAIPSGEYAPDVYYDDDNDTEIQGEGWQALTGWTGQHGYNGAVMHPSEYVGARMAEEMASMSTDESLLWTLVVVEVLPDEDDEDPEPAGWAVLYKRVEP